MDNNIKAYDNSTTCPKCDNKMWFSRKQRMYFHWEHLMNRECDIVTEIRCKFCGASYDRFTGNYVDSSIKKEK